MNYLFSAIREEVPGKKSAASGSEDRKSKAKMVFWKKEPTFPRILPQPSQVSTKLPRWVITLERSIYELLK